MKSWIPICSIDEDNGARYAKSASMAALLILFALILGSGCETHKSDAPESVITEAESTRQRSAQTRLLATELPTLQTAKMRSRQSAFRKLLDPHRDGWTTEAFAAKVQSQLKVLASILQSPRGDRNAPMEDIFAPNFACSWIRPSLLDTVFADDVIKVNRVAARVNRNEPALAVSSPKKLSPEECLLQFLEPFDKNQPIRVTLKPFRIGQTESALSTDVSYVAIGKADGQALQQQAHWRCRWTAANNAPPQLSAIDVIDYEEVTTTGDHRPVFTDVTESVLGENDAYRGQLRLGIDDWLSRIERRFRIFHDGHHGLALGDVNGDGLDDLYVCQPGGLPNRMFVQLPDGTARDVSASAGVDILDACHSALFLDFDNDGDQDLVVATASLLALFDNRGDGRFQLRSSLSDVRDAYSLAAADYDGDGRLDLFACRYDLGSAQGRQFPQPVPYHNAQNGAANFLLKNMGDWQFENVTVRTGLGVANNRFSFAASWEDFDGDGDIDLYVANDFGPNNLYRNDGSRFVDISREAHVKDVGSGMSVSWGDFNRDGRNDLFVGNMFSAAGNRIAYQPEFNANVSDQTRMNLRRLARGNSLFENLGGGQFFDRSHSARITHGLWAWSSVFADINNDGWQDMLVANGYVTGAREDDL